MVQPAIDAKSELSTSNIAKSINLTTVSLLDVNENKRSGMGEVHRVVL